MREDAIFRLILNIAYELSGLNVFCGIYILWVKVIGFRTVSQVYSRPVFISKNGALCGKIHRF